MFGKRSNNDSTTLEQRQAPAPQPPPPAPVPAPSAKPPQTLASASEPGRMPFPSAGLGAPLIGAPTSKPNVGGQKAPPPQIPTAIDSRRSESYYEVKGTIFGALIEAIDLAEGSPVHKGQVVARIVPLDTLWSITNATDNGTASALK